MKALGTLPLIPSTCVRFQTASQKFNFHSWNVNKRKFFRVTTCFASRDGAGDSSDKTAENYISTGLELFKKGSISAALTNFNKALTLNPSPEEAQAALYNKACCHVQREEAQEAQAALREALGKYDLRFSVILTDPDMAAFRALPQFSELQTEARLGGTEVGSGFRRDLKLLSEVRAPFRGVRKFLYVGLGMAAGIGTLFTIPQLIQAFKGGENAPELLSTVENLAVNVGGGIVLAALFIFDQKKEEEQMAKIQRDETLSRLPVKLSSNKFVELGQLRETTRPVILVGDKVSVERSIRVAERYRSDLMERGILILPLNWDEPEDNLNPFQKASVVLQPKKGFGEKALKGKKEEIATITEEESATGLTLDEFEERAKELSAKRIGQLDNKFKAQVVSPGEWKEWVRQVQKAEGVKPGENVFLLLRLDGRLRKSGKGMPDWGEIVKEVPPLDALVSKLER